MSDVTELRNYIRDRLDDRGADPDSAPWFVVKNVADLPGVLQATDRGGRVFEIAIYEVTGAPN